MSYWKLAPNDAGMACRIMPKKGLTEAELARIAAAKLKRDRKNAKRAAVQQRLAADVPRGTVI